MNIKFELKHVAQAVAVAAILSAPAAQAGVTHWGDHGNLETKTTLVPTLGAFDDSILFRTSTNGQLNSVAVSNNLPSVLNVTGGTVSLYQGTYGDFTPDTLMSSYSFDGTTGSTDHDVAGVLGGYSYYYVVSGIATGSSGATHVMTSTLTLVREPKAYAMILASLGLMGFAVNRR